MRGDDEPCGVWDSPHVMRPSPLVWHCWQTAAASAAGIAAGFFIVAKPGSALSPPAATCSEPGPWHDSQPGSASSTPGPSDARPRGLVMNSSKSSLWQSLQASEPTRFASPPPAGAWAAASVSHEETTSSSGTSRPRLSFMLILLSRDRATGRRPSEARREFKATPKRGLPQVTADAPPRQDGALGVRLLAAQKSVTRAYCPTSRLPCGSSASRNPSPRKLNARSVSDIASPGKITSQGNNASSRPPSETSVPHDASGGWTPSPRKLKKASCNITAGTVSVVYTITGPSVLGTMWRNTIARSVAPSARAASTNVWCLSESTCPRTIRAIVSH